MNTFWQKLPKPFFVLAPMEAVTDIVFRHVVAAAAPPDVYFTEFVNTASYCSPKGNHSTRERLEFSADEQPIVAQIWGTNPEHFALMAKGLKESGFAGIDINMGCPAKDVIKTGACSALIENPSLAAEIIAATKEGELPVSVKTRIGFKTSKTEEWLGFLLAQQLAALTVHGRTQNEMSKVPAHWDEIKKAVPIRDDVAPGTLIVGNGDVVNRSHGEKLAALHNLDGIMIGRGIFTDPYCFEKTPRTPKTRNDYLKLLYLQLELHDKAAEVTPRRYEPLKRFYKIYIRDFEGASEIRDALMHTHTTKGARAVLEEKMLHSRVN